MPLFQGRLISYLRRKVNCNVIEFRTYYVIQLRWGNILFHHIIREKDPFYPLAPRRTSGSFDNERTGKANSDQQSNE